MKRSHGVNVAVFPATSGANPYYSLFYGEIKKSLDVNVIDSEFTSEWLEKKLPSLDIVHFHWVGQYYVNDSLLISLKRAFNLILFVNKVRKSKALLVWTLHNFLPHETRSRTLDYLVRLLIVLFSDLVIVHSETAKKKAKKLLFIPSNRIVVMRHGNYIGEYQNYITQSDARKRLNIDERDFVYLFFGEIRPYKGVEVLIKSFREIKDKDCVLLIAGKPIDNHYKNIIENLASGDNRIRLNLEFVPDDEVQFYLNASSVSVLPFKKILTSGSLMLFLTFGLPVVVPDKPSILECLDRRVAYVYKDDEMLADAMHEARKQIESGEIVSRDEIVRFSNFFNWDSVVKPVVEKLRELL